MFAPKTSWAMICVTGTGHVRTTVLTGEIFLHALETHTVVE